MGLSVYCSFITRMQHKHREVSSLFRLQAVPFLPCSTPRGHLPATCSTWSCSFWVPGAIGSATNTTSVRKVLMNRSKRPPECAKDEPFAWWCSPGMSSTNPLSFCENPVFVRVLRFGILPSMRKIGTPLSSMPASTQWKKARDLRYTHTKVRDSCANPCEILRGSLGNA